MKNLGGVGSRREAREDALALLYEIDISGDSIAEVLQRRDDLLGGYAVELASGVAAETSRLDAVLRCHLTGWSPERLAVVDRALARMATWELLNRPDVPRGAIMSELVELATQYCGSEAPRFLNGLLRAVADDLRGTGEALQADAALS